MMNEPSALRRSASTKILARLRRRKAPYIHQIPACPRLRGTVENVFCTSAGESLPSCRAEATSAASQPAAAMSTRSSGPRTPPPAINSQFGCADRNS